MDRQALGELLDEQYQRLLAEVKSTRELALNQFEARRELVEFLQTEEGRALLLDGAQRK